MISIRHVHLEPTKIASHPSKLLAKIDDNVDFEYIHKLLKQCCHQHWRTNSNALCGFKIIKLSHQQISTTPTCFQSAVGTIVPCPDHCRVPYSNLCAIFPRRVPPKSNEIPINRRMLMCHLLDFTAEDSVASTVQMKTKEELIDSNNSSNNSHTVDSNHELTVEEYKSCSKSKQHRCKQEQNSHETHDDEFPESNNVEIIDYKTDAFLVHKVDNIKPHGTAAAAAVWQHPDETLNDKQLQAIITKEEKSQFWKAFGRVLESPQLLSDVLVLMREMCAMDSSLRATRHRQTDHYHHTRQQHHTSQYTSQHSIPVAQIPTVHNSAGSFILRPVDKDERFEYQNEMNIEEIFSLLGRIEFQILWSKDAIAVVPLKCITPLFSNALEFNRSTR